ncbi:helix-turn-helix transcriptional regulator [Picosynechococcus sp. PCC 11901]|uniref:helix-turn-helix domain-containing protein n=1 Tax=Picosynechococcus sp. PCC 11901 TaxID=2579791 RepID=UPI0010FC3BA8|nr:helix-turn-helix transcriptional regulator [Picosynechococcus sp. PCC 11901]QCS48282.1 helix-turn-helix transcriptional regulator [Picosynechococcus sp. PCC 11901]
MSLIVCRQLWGLGKTIAYVNSNFSENRLTKQFGYVVKKRRIELSLSQEELAFRANLHRTYISDIERGSRNPSLKNIFRIAQALEISVSQLFSEIE